MQKAAGAAHGEHVWEHLATEHVVRANVSRGRADLRADLVLSSRASYSSFQTVASGRFVPEPDGTRIGVDLGVSALVVVLTLLWLCGVGVFALVGLLVLLANGEVSRDSIFLLLPTGMLVFGVVLCILGRKEAGSDTASLLRFLRETLGTEETGDASS